MPTVIDIKPFKIDMLREQMNATVRRALDTLACTARHASPNADTRRGAAIDATFASGAVAEALTWVLCALTGTRHEGSHRVGNNARHIDDRAQAITDPALREATLHAARIVRAMNGGTFDARRVAYSLEPESPEQWVRRLRAVIKAHTDIVDGVIAGTGPLAALGSHERIDEVRAATRRHTLWTCEELARTAHTLALPEDLDGEVRQWYDHLRRQALDRPPDRGKSSLRQSSDLLMRERGEP